jgi:hypothetical protein
MKRSEALKIRRHLETAVQSLPDEDSLEMVTFYPGWEIGKNYSVDQKLQYNGKLYKVITAHTSQADWTPDITASLFTAIVEHVSGSIDDPIHYEGNMILEEGLYYTQGGVVYICTRDSLIALHNTLADLVGLYVAIA